MKKLYALLLPMLLIAGLTACGGNDTAIETPTTPTAPPIQAEPNNLVSEDEEDEDNDPIENVASEIIGNWNMTSTDSPIQILGLENGWGYEIVLLEDGIGAEWWFSPETGWHEIFHFVWSAEDGQVTITHTSLNSEVVAHYLGDEAVEMTYSVIGIPIVGEYYITGDMITLMLGELTFVYRKN